MKEDELVKQVMDGLEEYAGLTADAMKKAVKKAGKAVAEEIATNAPKDTGKYAKSWTSKVTTESSSKITLTVYSKNRAQLTHLLENGHATKNGGRVEGRPHIEPASEKADQILEEEIKKALENE